MRVLVGMAAIVGSGETSPKMRRTSSKGICSRFRQNSSGAASAPFTRASEMAVLASRTRMTPAEAAALRVVVLDTASDSEAWSRATTAPPSSTSPNRLSSATGPSGPWPMRVKAISISSGGPRVTRASRPTTDTALAAR